MSSKSSFIKYPDDGRKMVVRAILILIFISIYYYLVLQLYNNEDQNTLENAAEETYFRAKCGHDCHLGCSLMEHLVGVICKSRKQSWYMLVKILLSIRENFSMFFDGMSDRFCGLLSFLLTIHKSILKLLTWHRNNSCSFCLKNFWKIIEKDKKSFGWIPGTLHAADLNIVSRIIISLVIILGYLAIVIGSVFL